MQEVINTLLELAYLPPHTSLHAGKVRQLGMHSASSPVYVARDTETQALHCTAGLAQTSRRRQLEHCRGWISPMIMKSPR